MFYAMIIHKLLRPVTYSLFLSLFLVNVEPSKSFPPPSLCVSEMCLSDSKYNLLFHLDSLKTSSLLTRILLPIALALSFLFICKEIENIYFDIEEDILYSRLAHISLSLTIFLFCFFFFCYSSFGGNVLLSQWAFALWRQFLRHLLNYLPNIYTSDIFNS